ncbi:MAG TPA: hypothetical protein VMT80_01785 [Candidatus Paceibacterota bacterium]|nr:hypothetical protein [Candidatus Paceibacterota bacterium]
MEKKKIGELMKYAVYRRTNGKTYCLLPAIKIGNSYSAEGGQSPILLPKSQIEVEVQKIDGGLGAFEVGEEEEFNPEEEVEVLWDGDPEPEKQAESAGSDDEIPY